MGAAVVPGSWVGVQTRGRLLEPCSGLIGVLFSVSSVGHGFAYPGSRTHTGTVFLCQSPEKVTASAPSPPTPQPGDPVWEFLYHCVTSLVLNSGPGIQGQEPGQGSAGRGSAPGG